MLVPLAPGLAFTAVWADEGDVGRQIRRSVMPRVALNTEVFAFLACIHLAALLRQHSFGFSQAQLHMLKLPASLEGDMNMQGDRESLTSERL